MSVVGQRLNGRCLCGAITFTATPQRDMHACHCETCRRLSGGIMLAVDCGDTVEITRGEPATYESSDWAVRQFCGNCGSTLFWRAREGHTVYPAIQTFEDVSAFELEAEYCIDLKPGSYALTGDHPRLTAEELMALFADDPA